MFCSNCGNEFHEGSVCPVCGVATAVPEPTKNPGKGQGIAAMVLGIVSLVASMSCPCILPFIGGIVPFITSIVGLVLASKGKKKSDEVGLPNGNAKAGKIMSITALILVILISLIMLVPFVLVLLGASGEFVDGFNRGFNEGFNDGYNSVVGY